MTRRYRNWVEVTTADDDATVWVNLDHVTTMLHAEDRTVLYMTDDGPNALYEVVETPEQVLGLPPRVSGEGAP